MGLHLLRAIAFFVMAWVVVGGSGHTAADSPLPVKKPPYPSRDGDIRNPYTFEDIHGKIGDGDTKGLSFFGDSHLQGTIYTGPYPFEAGESDYDYARYRTAEKLETGKGTLRIDKFLDAEEYNANKWPAGQGDSPPTMTVGYRFDISSTDPDKAGYYGFYDGVVSFRRPGGKDKEFLKNLTIVEGPLVIMATSDDPTTVAIAFETDEPCAGAVEISRPFSPFGEVGSTHFNPVRQFKESAGITRHEIRLTGLRSNMKYDYRIQCEKAGGESARSSVYSFKTAPLRGKGRVSFAFISDSREGVGGGERNYMGHNLHSLSRLANDAYRRGADLFICGGDLVNGYTSEVDDFRLQLRGWKQAMAGFWRSRPVYTAMGNHETLINVYDPPKGHPSKKYGISLDKWPYSRESTEAIFAEQLWNPENGPVPSDPRRPAYKENVYHFQYGPVLFIAFNNNYWWTTNIECKNYGGSPEGYVMDDQLTWIESVLAGAETDPTVRYIVLYAQEPVFPSDGHVKDGMWWSGNNNMRAWTWNGTTLEDDPAGGMIEVRNRFWMAISRSSKVAAVLTGDEHAYHRLLVDSTTPVGLYPGDDTDGDGVLDRYSPNPNFANPTWHITAGSAGAPYFAEARAKHPRPWTPDFFSSQTGYCLFKADEDGISMTFYTITGQELDRIENLMAVKW